MAWNGRRISPYEIIESGRLKSTQRKSDQLNAASDAPEKAPEPKVFRVRPWPNRPKKVRFFTDRAELSLSYQVVVVAALVCLLVFLLVMRFSRKTAPENTSPKPDSGPIEARQAEQVPDSGAEKAAQVDDYVEQNEQKAVAQKLADHIIVIQNSEFQSHLVPVKRYFAEHGIETEIAQAGSMYRIVTRQKFENPEKEGTDGYTARQRIVEIGAGYKPPQGYPGFGKKPFHDAYGMKIVR